MKKRLGTAVFAVLFLGVMFGGLFNMSSGMSMTGDTSGCPFMEHGEVMCSMSVFDHFVAWKSTFTAVVPTLTILLAAMSAVVAVVTVAPNLILSRRLLYNQIFKQRRITPIFTHSVRPLQELFSQGILNPKLF